MWATWAKMSASFGLPAKGAIRHCYSEVVCRKCVHTSFPTSRHLHNRTAANKTAQTCPQNSTHVPTEQYTPTSVLLIASQPSRNILQSALHRCQLSRQGRQSLQCARVSGVVGKTRVQRQPTRVPDPGHGGGHPTRAWHFHQPHLLDVPTNHGCYPREHCTSTNDNSVRRGWGRCGKRGSVLHVMSNGPPTRRRISTGPPRALAFQYWTIGRKLATVNSIWEPDRSRCIGEVAATQRPGTGIHPQ